MEVGVTAELQGLCVECQLHTARTRHCRIHIAEARSRPRQSRSLTEGSLSVYAGLRSAASRTPPGARRDRLRACALPAATNAAGTNAAAGPPERRRRSAHSLISMAASAARLAARRLFLPWCARLVQASGSGERVGDGAGKGRLLRSVPAGSGF